METTRMSSKGQVIIPKSVRNAHHWETGQDLVVIDVGDGVLLRTRNVFPQTSLSEVASCLRFTGKSKTDRDMEKAIEKGVKETFRDLG